MAVMDTNPQRVIAKQQYQLSQMYNGISAASTTNITTIMPNIGWMGQDPLAAAAPRPESDKDWLRRRVKEVLWKPV